MYNSQDMEATQVPINRWLAYKNVAYICNEILLNNEKEWNTAICSNVDGPREYYALWNKSEKDKYYMT